jgi:uncharacterized membrane protein YhaH (DUF805 family)
MRGNVIGFDPDTNTGAISGHDGNRYDFATQDWHGRRQPRHGDIVDFQAQGGRALDIYFIEPEYVAPTIGQFYFSPSGRISRSQYWLRFTVPYFVIYFVLNIAADVADDKSAAHSVLSAIVAIYAVVALWPSIAILVKRMHDRNRPGWMCLILYVPVTLCIVLLIVWFAGAIAAAAASGTFSPPPLDALGITVILLAMVSGIVSLWFFVEFGCLRGTVGPNQFGPDPVR